MISMLIGNRELFENEKDSKAGDVLYIDRYNRMPDGSPTRVTKIVLGESVASDVYTRAPLFDLKTCQVSGGW